MKKSSITKNHKDNLVMTLTSHDLLSVSFKNEISIKERKFNMKQSQLNKDKYMMQEQSLFKSNLNNSKTKLHIFYNVMINEYF